MKPLIISADDFAQSPAIDSGILDLIAQDRITATSCLVMSPRWVMAAKQIKQAIRAKADIGLHLDFTQFNQTARFSLPEIMLKAACRQLPSAAIKKSISAQLTAFEDALGTPPDYIDGHQHVHQLPQIREALIKEVSTRYPQKQPWVRISKPMPPRNFKARIIDWSGATELKHLCDRAGLPSTDLLAGIYDYTPHATDYLTLLEHWCAEIAKTEKQVALMCHPAHAENGVNHVQDAIYLNRTQEYAAFNQESFLKILQRYQIRLECGRRLFQSA